jgi:hypothetical protein
MVPKAQKKLVLASVVTVSVGAALGSVAPDLMLSIALALSDCVHPYYRVLANDTVDVLLPLRAVMHSHEIDAFVTLLTMFALFVLLAAIYVAIVRVCLGFELRKATARRYIFPIAPLSLTAFYLPLFLFVSLRTPTDTITNCIFAVTSVLAVLLWLGGIVFSAKRSQWVTSSPRVSVPPLLRKMCVPDIATAPTWHALETLLQGVRGALPGCPRGLVFYVRVFILAVAPLVISLLAATVSKPCGVQTTLLTVACIVLALAILFLRPMAVPILNGLLAVGYAVLAALACAMVLESDRVVTALKFLLDAVVLLRVLISVIGRFLARSSPLQADEAKQLTENINASPESN